MSRLVKFYAPLAIGLVIFFAVPLSAGLFSAESVKSVMGMLSDGAFVAGILLAGAGGLSFAASKGMYDVFGYGFNTMKDHFVLKKNKRAGSLYDYKQKKDAERRGWLKETLFVGLGFIVLAGVFMIAYILL